MFPFTPVTPPPDNQTFTREPAPRLPPMNPDSLPPLRGILQGAGISLRSPTSSVGRDTTTTQKHRPTQPPTLEHGTQGEAPKRVPLTMQPPPPPTPALPPHSTSQHPHTHAGTQSQPWSHAPAFPLGQVDSKDIPAATRIAAFYQQRCHAVANYQQMRCQAWASAYRQKCQEAMQAATLVVAWYVRDRIRRRRRRRKDKFRRGLRERRGVPRAERKGEAVRRWMMGVPRDVHPADTLSMDRAADKEEGRFSVDEEIQPDADAKLFQVADSLIKRQYRGLEVPLMGVLSFEESESEGDMESARGCSKCDGEGLSEMEVMGDMPDREFGEDGEAPDEEVNYDDYEEYEDYDEELYEDDDMDEPEEEEVGSELVHGGGTGQNSQNTEAVLPLL